MPTPVLPRRFAAPSGRRFAAFTLIELIVVIVIMGLLVAIGAFAYNQVTESSHKQAAKSLAEQFARDVYGITSAHQSSVSTLGAAGVQDAIDDVTKVGGTVDWPSAPGPEGQTVAGVVRGGYCTPVLFPQTRERPTLGATFKATGCSTTDGTLPSGPPPPVLAPAGLGVAGAVTDKVTLTWDPVAQATSYSVYIDGTVAWTGTATTTGALAVPAGAHVANITASKGSVESPKSGDLAFTTYTYNDMYADAWPLPAVGAGSQFTSDDVTNAAATTQTGEPQAGGNVTVRRSLWWTFTAPGDGSYAFNVVAPVTGPMIGAQELGVYADAPAIGGATLLKRVDNANPASVQVALSVGQTVRVQVANYTWQGNPSAAGAFRLQVTRGPVNDNFAAAASVSLDATGSFTSTDVNNTLAGVEVGEPQAGGNWTVARSVWWTFTAPATTSYAFNVLAPTTGPMIGVQNLGVYTGSAVGSTTVVGRDPLTNPAKVNVNLVAGTVVKIQVANGVWQGGATTPGSFRLQVLQGPDNDLYAQPATVGAVSAGSGWTSADVDNTRATVETGEPMAGSNTYVKNSLWWRFTVPTTGSYTFSVLNPTTGTKIGTNELGVYTEAATISPLTMRGRVNNAANATVTLNLTAGEVVRIQVGNYQWQAGAYTPGSFKLGVTLN